MPRLTTDMALVSSEPVAFLSRRFQGVWEHWHRLSQVLFSPSCGFSLDSITFVFNESVTQSCPNVQLRVAGHGRGRISVEGGLIRITLGASAIELHNAKNWHREWSPNPALLFCRRLSPLLGKGRVRGSLLWYACAHEKKTNGCSQISVWALRGDPLCELGTAKRRKRREGRVRAPTQNQQNSSCEWIFDSRVHFGCPSMRTETADAEVSVESAGKVRESYRSRAVCSLHSTACRMEPKRFLNQ
eukprot:2149467-Rhodomonas_salina.1